MTTKTVNVQQVVKVTVDDSKFDEKFMREFVDSMYPFRSIDDHLEHLAQLAARGIATEHCFIEGYGPAGEMGIKFEITDVFTEIPTE